MMSKLVMITSILAAIAAIGYVGYDRWEENYKPGPVVVVNDPVGCIAESYSSMDEWSAKNRAFIMVEIGSVDEITTLCNDTGLTVVSQHKCDKSDFALLICIWNSDIDENQVDAIRKNSAVKFIDVHTQLKEEDERTKIKSWDLKSWIDPLEEGATFQGGDDAQYNSTTQEPGAD